MRERILIAGSGGQGVLLIGRILASVAMKHVPHVTFFPSYGVEVRGGTSNCQVVLASDEISSPVCETFDTMIIMNQASQDRFMQDVPDDTTLCILNTSLCEPPDHQRVMGIPATDWANELGDTRAANLIMLGAYIGRRNMLERADVETGIRSAFNGKSTQLAALNLRAFEKGFFL